MTAMRKLFGNVRCLVGILALGLSLGSCVSENPFDSTDGNGILRINPVFRSDVTISTRSDGDYTQETLGKNLIVYIEGDNQTNPIGIVRKYQGIGNIPSTISLKEGKYVVEAWTGDSVSASWDKKFFRAWQDTEIKASDPQSLTLKCNIANVLVSVVPESLGAGLSDLTVSFWHSRKGADDEYVLTFNEDKIKEGIKGYFMMPTVDHSTGAKEKEINYKLTGYTEDGNEIVKEGIISNVDAAHEYKLSVVANLDETNPAGGALVRLDIVDIPVLESTFDIIPAPTYEAYYKGKKVTDLSRQIDLTSGSIYDYKLTTLCYGGCSSMTLTFSENFNDLFKEKFENLSGRYQVQIINDKDARNKFSALGLNYDRSQKLEQIVGTEGEAIEADEIELSFTADFLRRLPISQSEYKVEIKTIDGGWSGRPDHDKQLTSTATIRFANSDACLERVAPVGAADMSKPENIDYTAITTTSATLYGEIYSDEAANYGISYSVKGADLWTDIPAAGTRAAKGFYVNLSGLTPGTRYEYKVYCDGYREELSHEFSTESKFVIPNASMEEWSELATNNNVLLPGGGGVVSFWDTGNHGSATMKKLVTNYSDTYKHSGSRSAELKSQFVGVATFGKFAAGNLFVGSYDKTDGTDGELTFGREYNGSHPKSLTLYANYRPGTAEKNVANSDYIAQGAKDQGQIYVALTSEPVKIKTKSKELFNPDGDYVVAYGQVTWTDNFGADGTLDKVTINLDYKDRAKTTAPKYLVIVCSASKYGDFFCGGEGSLLYVDDFELEY